MLKQLVEGIGLHQILARDVLLHNGGVAEASAIIAQTI